MAIMTPRGLKVYVECQLAFALIARAWDVDRRTDAFRILKTCEAIEVLPGMLGTLFGGAAVLFPSAPSWLPGAGALGGAGLGWALVRSGLWWIPPMRQAATVWSYFSGWGLLICATVGLIWWQMGWVAVIAFLIGRLAGAAIDIFADTEGENFYHAFRFHARRVGASSSISVPDEELLFGQWRLCLLDYAAKWPEAVLRFPADQTPEAREVIEMALQARAKSSL